MIKSEKKKLDPRFRGVTKRGLEKANHMTTHPDEELAWTPAWRLKEMFAARQLSPLEYARFLLARVERLADLGAFISVFPEILLEQAKDATEQLTRGDQELPLLHGLPVGVKDSVFTKGQRTTLASLLFKDHVPEIDSVASEKLKQAGAIIFGKTNMPEFELNRRSMNLLVREAVNPWDRTRTSGGSSGGAAVAGAAGMARCRSESTAVDRSGFPALSMAYLVCCPVAGGCLTGRAILRCPPAASDR